MQSFLLLAGAATPFFAVYVQQKLGGPKEMVALYLGVTTFSNLVANILFGRISFRHGNRRVMFLAAAAGIGMSALVLALALLAGPLRLSPTAASWWLVPVFALAGIRGTAIGVSGNSLLLEIAPAKDRSLYVGFTQSLLGIVLLLTSLSGVVVALLGFSMVVLVTLLAHMAAFYVAWKISRSHPAMDGNRPGPA
jgi:MFS family permease